jgi:hypothetical protein
MDPYLETPHLWPDVHHELISEIRHALNPIIRPNYVARVELRVYISDENDPGLDVIIPDARIEKTRRRGRKPARSTSNGSSALAIAEPLLVPIKLDEEIEEARLEIVDVRTGSLVAIIEVLSPTNKIRGSEGRRSLLKKRHETVESDVHWVEIDLLRAGAPTIGYGGTDECDYRVLVSKAERRRCFRFWPIDLRAALPVVGIPLRAPDPDVPLDMGAVLRATYDRADYDLSVDYHKPPDPPLRKDDAKWADKLLRHKGLR